MMIAAITLLLATACSGQTVNSYEGEGAVIAQASRPAKLAEGEPELPRVYLNTNYTAPAGRAITVNAGGDFQAALNQAKPGDIISLQAGATFTGNFTLPNKPGGDAGNPWIVILSSAANDKLPPPGTRATPAHSSAMPKLISPNSDPVIATAKGAHHYRFIGIEFGLAPGKSTYNLISFDSGARSIRDLPRDLIIDRCYIHGNSTGNARRGVALNSASTAVIDSYISEIHEVGADSQAICGWNGPGPFKIVNNYLEGAGENVMFGGADPGIQNLIPSDIEFRRNHLAKPLKWKVGSPSYAGVHWSVKNLFELKNAQRALIDSNIFEYNWADGQSGAAIVFTPRNQDGDSPWSVVQDISFINNIVRHTGSGFNIAGRDDIAGTSEPSRRILIRNNLLEDISSTAWGGDGEMFQIVGGAEDISIDHNTGFATGNIIMTESGEELNKRLVFTNNIVPHNSYGVIGTDTGVGTVTLNRWFAGYVFQKNVIIGGKASSYPSGNYFVNSFNDVGFSDVRKGDYRLSSSSPYRNAGIGGKDIGCNINTLNRAVSTTGGNGAPKPTSDNYSGGGTHR